MSPVSVNTSAMGALAGAKLIKAPLLIAEDVVEKGPPLFMKRFCGEARIYQSEASEEDIYYKLLKSDEEDQDLGLEGGGSQDDHWWTTCGPNVAKPLHVGHLRSAIIGESVKRIARKMGHKVLGDIHLGDWDIRWD